jgi:hypothetical protein
MCFFDLKKMKADTDNIIRRANMEQFAYTLEKMLQEKLQVYKELKKIFEQEKNYIVDMDIDSLWRMADGKNQMASEIESIRERILCLLGESKISFNIDLKTFSVSSVIDCLPIPVRSKSVFKKIKIELDILKKDLTVIASENKRYTNEYLSVINGVFATITASKNREQYSNAGYVMENEAPKHLIKAEV